MNNIMFKLIDGRTIEANPKNLLIDVVKKNNLEKDIPVVLADIGGKIFELHNTVEESFCENKEFKVIDITHKVGMRVFIRTLKFILVKATVDIFPNARISMEHSLSKGLFGEIHKGSRLSEEDVKKIKLRMTEIIDGDLPIRRVEFSKEEAIEIFKSYGMEDKVRAMEYVDSDIIHLYELGGRYDYFYGAMAYSTGVINIFDLIQYESGFILKFPTRQKPNALPKFEEHKKLGKIFYETERWAEILHVSDVGKLNYLIENDKIAEMIRVNEALHEKKIAHIADMIKERPDVKIALIAGPSSSGKTTFTKRLGIQLRVLGYNPTLISLDDYFVNREQTPKDENGEYDFESIYALDLELFNDHLKALLDGEEIEIPEFNFKAGKREYNGRKLKIPQGGILLIEGIHGLNEMLTNSIPKENKFKIYISCLTQLNIDDHNRIPTTDVRTVRRIVRDTLSRGLNAENTLMMWPSIRRGEERNIFVFQEEADVMFNSNLVYELSVLKKYAIKELVKIKEDSPVYYDAWKLITFLNMFREVDKELVPDNSILREFVGGSYFYKY